MRAIGKEARWLLVLFGLCAGCESPSVYEQIRSEDPSTRVEAIVQVGNNQNAQALPHLVERLSDTEPQVRLATAIALEKITGETLGYEYYAPPEQRDEAIRRWRRFLQQRASASPAGGRPATPSTSQPATIPAQRPDREGV